MDINTAPGSIAESADQAEFNTKRIKKVYDRPVLLRLSGRDGVSGKDRIKTYENLTKTGMS